MPPPSNRGPPNFPKEEPAIPLEPAVAKARSAYIKNMIDKIKQLKNQGKTVDEIRQVEGIQRFSEDYPQLFKLLTKGEDFNEGSLRTMIALLEKMGTGEIDQNQASVIVGQRLHDIYIKPKLSE
jgi:hypothetical protein